MPLPFEQEPVYQSAHPNVICAAHISSDPIACQSWLANEVSDRVFDGPMSMALQEDLQAVKADGFDISLLEEIANAAEPDATMGDIGEAMADLFLIEQRNAILSANRRRDLRSGKGSLPGADIVGYLPVSSGVFEFLFGEVKASSQMGAPPSVMAYTGDGMPAQLKRLATKSLTQKRLILYLRSRIKTDVDRALYDSATRSLANGRFALVGVLVRDTTPNPKDVNGAALHLSENLPQDRAAMLNVLHVCVPSADWPLHCKPKS